MKDKSVNKPPAEICSGMGKFCLVDSGRENGGYRNNLIAILLLAGLTLLTYANTLHDTGFAFDNGLILVDSRLHAFNIENLRLIFTQDYWWSEDLVIGLYRPLTSFSYLFNYAVLGNGVHATGYHLVNLLLHTANVWLVYFLIMGVVTIRGPAFFAAAIFAVHPINVEAVTNIIGRADLLATLTVLAGIHCYIRGTAAIGGKKIFWLIGLTTLSTIGVFCKENGVLTLPLLILYDLTFRLKPGSLKNLVRQLGRFMLKGYLALLPSLLLFVIIRRMVYDGVQILEVGFLENPLAAADFWTARLTAVKVVGKYLTILFWPRHLSSDYSYNQVPLVQWPFLSWEDWQTALVLVFIIFLAGIAVLSYRRRRDVFFMIVFGCLTYLPTANLLPKPGAPIFAKESWLIGSMMGERFMYMPSIGFAGCLVLAIYALWNYLSKLGGARRFGFLLQKQIAVVVFLSLLVGALACRSFIRNFDWENELILTSQDVQVASNSHRLHGMLAWALFHNDTEGTQIDRVIEHGEKAAAMAGEISEKLFLRLGDYYLRKGDLVGATLGDTEELIVTPERRGWYEKGVTALRRAAELENLLVIRKLRAEGEDLPTDENSQVVGGNVATYFPLGIALRRLGRKAEALETFLTMRRLDIFDQRTYLQLAFLHEENGDLDLAALALLQAVVLNNQEQGTVEYLARIYGKMAGGSCAVEPNRGRAVLDFTCPLVQRQVCQANLELVELFLPIKKFDTAWEFVQGSVRVFNCDQGIYDHLLPKEQ